jgi:putative transposase
MFASTYQDTLKEKAYSSDLTPSQWAIVKPLLTTSHTGRPITLPLKDVIDAIFYQLANGCKWKDLPHDFPDYRRDHEWFTKWREDGTWDRLLDQLRRRARAAAGRDPEPSEACFDSQTVKAAATGGERGYDGGKRINGRKRHILVDTLGLLLAVLVTVGSVTDAAGAVQTLRENVFATTHPRLVRMHVDTAYGRRPLTGYLKSETRVPIELVIRVKPEGARGFVPIKKRWVVERTFGWFGKYRGLDKDYEANPRASEAKLKAAMIHIILKRKLQLGPTATQRLPLGQVA